MRIRLLLVSAILVIVAGCGGGGGGGGQGAPAAIWGQFRHDNQRTGFGIGIIQEDDRIVDFEVVDLPGGAPPSAISSSPSIDAEGRIYIATEGGTLASFEAGDDVERRWTVNRCNRCPIGQEHLGPLVSSPAVYTFRDTDGVNQTSIFLGSMDNAVFLYHFRGSEVVDSDSCQVCFARGDARLKRQFLDTDPTANVNISFASSPTFSVNLGTGSVAGIFIGATITIEHSDGTTETQGKLYAINNDGSLRWEFPRAGEPSIGPVTSSPAFAIGQSIYFTTTADPRHPGGGDVLYTISEGGSLKRSQFIPGLTDPLLPLSPSPMTSATIFMNSVDGVIHAMNPDGTFLWDAELPGERLITSLIIGSQNEETATPEPNDTPTPTGRVELITATPTPTETPLRLNSTVLGVTESGMLFAIDSSNGAFILPTGRRPSVPVQGTVVASPALSGDLFLLFGTTEGQLFSLDTATAQLPRFCDGGENDNDLCTSDRDCVDGFCGDSFWPLLLPRSCSDGEQRSRFCNNDDDCPGGVCRRPGIRSSPSIDLDGTIYVAADDGRLYAIDDIDDITPRMTATPSRTPTPESGVTRTHTHTATSTMPPTVSLTTTPTITATIGSLPTETTAPSPSPTPEPETTATPESTATESEATATPESTATETVQEAPSPTPVDTLTPEPTASEIPAP